MKLTKRVVENLEVAEKRYEIRDNDPIGFLVRVGESGNKAFYYVYRAGKGRAAPLRRLHLGNFPTVTVEQARSLAKQKAAMVVEGQDPVEQLNESKNELVTREVLDLFLEQYADAKLKKATARQYRSITERLVSPVIGNIKITKATHKHIASLHYSLRETPYQANRCIALLSKFFNWCEENGFRERRSNPVFGLKRYKEEKRIKFMQAAELEALGKGFLQLTAKDSLDPFIAAALQTMLYTGAHCGEVLSLKWEYLNIEVGIANLPDSKTGAKVLRLPPQVLEILGGLPHLNEYCFPGRFGKGHIVNVKDTWKRLLEAAGLEGWRIHDLRHAFASAAASSGKSLPVIGKILGHTQAATTSRYAHIADNPVDFAVSETATYLHKAFSGGCKVIPFQKAS